MDKFFRYINLFPMPLWLAMMFAPHNPVTKRCSRSSVVLMIAAFHYVLALFNAMRGSIRSDENALDFSSLAGISQGLGAPEGALAGWAHMVALDLFTGTWIYRQCQQLEAPAWVRVPTLLFTLLTGPFGLLLFLTWRLLRSRQSETI